MSRSEQVVGCQRRERLHFVERGLGFCALLKIAEREEATPKRASQVLRRARLTLRCSQQLKRFLLTIIKMCHLPGA